MNQQDTYRTGSLRQLMEPVASVTDQTVRRRVRLLAMLLLLLTLSLLVGIIARYLIRGELGIEMIIALPVMSLAYFLSRTRFHVIAVVLGMFSLAYPCFSLAFQKATSDPLVFSFSVLWLILPIFFASFILSLRGTVIADGILLFSSLSLYLFISPDNAVALGMAFSLLVVTAALSIGVAFVFRQDRRAISKQFNECARAEDNLRQAKEELETRVADRTVALGETNEQLTTLIQSSPVMVIILDQKGLVSLWNPTAEKILGWSEKEVIGGPPPFLTEGTLPEELLKEGRGEAPGTAMEVRVKSKGGDVVEATISIAPLSSATGAVMGQVLVLVDVSERKRLEEQLRHSQKMEAVGQLAGGVAHDFNNLLTVINGYTEIQLSSLAKDDSRRQDLDAVLAAGQRATALTEQLLAFSRRQVMRTQVLNLNEILYGMGKMFRRLIREDVALELKPGSELRSVEADRGQLEQVIINLVINASDAMPRGGTLTIETANLPPSSGKGERGAEQGDGDDRGVALVIMDTGEGIAPEVKERIFEPFFTTKAIGHGTGLGLATVYGIVTQSGGEIEVESEPGQGTTFKVLFPGVDEVSPVPQEEQGDPPGGDETILVVEDERAVRELTERMLRALGYTVITADNGREALAVHQQQGAQIDLLLTDVVMPEMGGPECVEQLWQQRVDLPVLFMSGYADQALDGRGILDGGSPMLHKPFSLAELATQVRRALDGP